MVSGTDGDDGAPGLIAVEAPEVGTAADRHDTGVVERLGPSVPCICGAEIDKRAAASGQRGGKPGRQRPRWPRPAQAYDGRDAAPAGFAEVDAAELRRAACPRGEHGAALDGVPAAIHPQHGIAPVGERKRKTARTGGKHEHAIAGGKSQLALDDAELLAGLIVTDRAVPKAVKELSKNLPVEVRNLAGRLAVGVARQSGAILLGMMTKIIGSTAFPVRVSAG